MGVEGDWVTLVVEPELTTHSQMHDEIVPARGADDEILPEPVDGGEMVADEHAERLFGVTSHRACTGDGDVGDHPIEDLFGETPADRLDLGSSGTVQPRRFGTYRERTSAWCSVSLVGSALRCRPSSNRTDGAPWPRRSDWPNDGAERCPSSPRSRRSAGVCPRRDPRSDDHRRHRHRCTHGATSPKEALACRRRHFTAVDRLGSISSSARERDDLVVHLRMSGQLRLHDQRDPVALHTMSGSGSDRANSGFVDPRTFGELFIAERSDDAGRPIELAALGPDALDPGVEGEALVAMLAVAPPR